MWATQLTSAAWALGDAFRAVVLSDHVGFSSLAALKQWPIAQLKIDLFFLRGIRRSERRGYVKAIIDLGHTLGIAVVAEGVETEAQLELLRQRGCDEAQGYLVARPMPVEKVTEFLANSASRWKER